MVKLIDYSKMTKVNVCIDDEILKSSGKNLNEQRKIGKYCDYTLKTDDGGEFTVHKNILESICPFFVTMFNSEFNDKNSDSVVLKRCSSSIVLGKLIEFMYTGQVEIPSEIAKDTLDAALFLGLNRLVDTCTQILVDFVDVDNCFELFEYSDTYFCGEDLTKKCTKVICENMEKFMNSPKFVKLSLDLVQILCDCDREVCNDEKLFLAMTKWIIFDFDDREKHISKLLDRIHFENMSYEFRLANILENNPFSNRPEFLMKIKDVIKNDWQQQLNKSKDPKNKIAHPKSSLGSIFSIIDRKIMRYSRQENTFTETGLELNTECIGCTFTIFNQNKIFVCGGVSTKQRDIFNLVLKTNELSNKCEYFCPEDRCWKDLPPLEIPRYMHRAVTLDGKIYVCGGEHESSVEIFDIGKAHWSKGGSIKDDSGWPGLCVLDKCIYILKNNLQQLDPRENYRRSMSYYRRNDDHTWETLATYKLKNEIFSAIGYDEKIYGFTREEIVTYDLRNRCWLDETRTLVQPYSYRVNFPKTCLVKNQIYVMAGNRDGNYSLHCYNASDLSLSFYSSISIPETDNCLGLFYGGR